MKNHSSYIVVCLSLFLFCLSGCLPPKERSGTSISTPVIHETVTSTREIFPTNVSDITPTASPQPKHSPTAPIVSGPVVLPRVTMLPSDSENALLKLLNTNGNCVGKCIAGIRPGHMTTQQAVDTMAQWGMISQYKMPKGGFSFSLTQKPPDSRVRVQLGVSTQPDNLESINSIDFGITNAASNDFVGTDLWLANFEKWQAFRFDNVIKAYGVPSYVGYFFESIGGENNTPLVKNALNYHMVIFFEKNNTTVNVSGRGRYSENGLSICPSTDSHNMSVEINSGVSLEKLEEVYPITWQATTNTDSESFFQHFTQKSDTCTTVTMEQIQTLQPWFH